MLPPPCVLLQGISEVIEHKEVWNGVICYVDTWLPSPPKRLESMLRQVRLSVMALPGECRWPYVLCGYYGSTKNGALLL